MHPPLPPPPLPLPPPGGQIVAIVMKIDINIARRTTLGGQHISTYAEAGHVRDLAGFTAQVSYCSVFWSSCYMNILCCEYITIPGSLGGHGPKRQPSSSVSKDGYVGLRSSSSFCQALHPVFMTQNPRPSTFGPNNPKLGPKP